MLGTFPPQLGGIFLFCAILVCIYVQVAPETQSSVAEEAAGPEDEPGSEEAGRNVAAEPAGMEAADPPAAEVAKPHPMKADGNRWSGATRRGALLRIRT